MNPVLSFCAALLLATATLNAATVESQLEGKLLRLENGQLVPAAAGTLAGKKYILFYFSASWCPSCHVFTPKLVEAYGMWKKRSTEFEVVLVGLDHSAADHAKYVKDHAMPFPVLAFEPTLSVPFLEKLKAAGPPYLVVADAEGHELIGRGSSDWEVPGFVLQEFEKRFLPAPASSPASPSWKEKILRFFGIH